MTDRRVAQALLGISLLAVPVTTWWLVGDLSEPGMDDHLYRAPAWLERHGTPIGITATVLVMAAIGWLASPPGRAALDRRARRAAVPLAALGLYAGLTYRVTTAAVGGANIGGGMLLLFGFGFVPLMVILAVLQLRAG